MWNMSNVSTSDFEGSTRTVGGVEKLASTKVRVSLFFAAAAGSRCPPWLKYRSIRTPVSIRPTTLSGSGSERARAIGSAALDHGRAGQKTTDEQVRCSHEILYYKWKIGKAWIGRNRKALWEAAGNEWGNAPKLTREWSDPRMIGRLSSLIAYTRVGS